MENTKKSVSLEKYIRWFSEIRKQDALEVGRKASYLGEIFNNKLPIPSGFVLTVDSFKYFLENSRIKEKIMSILETIDINNIEELNKRSNEIRALIEKQELPPDLIDEILEAYKILSTEKIDTLNVSVNALNILKNSEEPIFVSVRSSVSRNNNDSSFSGLEESYLYIKGERNLIDYIKKCFSSLYTGRAIYYRKRLGLPEETTLMGVIVMKMIDSDKSGVIFSKNPFSDNNEILLESAYGLCEGIVSGKIKPDNHIISDNLEIIEANISDKKIAVVRNGSGNLAIVKLTPDRSNSPALTNGQIIEAANYSLKLQEIFNQPQTIEFGIEGNKFYILESKPLSEGIKMENKTNISGELILSGTIASYGIASGTVRIIKKLEDLEKIQKGDIIVSEIISPEIIIAMEKCSGIITGLGGKGSHVSVVAREMKIPCIVGVKDLFEKLKEGMKISIDGYNGKIYSGEIEKNNVMDETKIIEIDPALKTEKVKLKLTIDSKEIINNAKNTGIRDIGLFKIESIIVKNNKHPLYFLKENKLDEYTELLKREIIEISNDFDLIAIRTDKIRTNEYTSLLENPKTEPNPLLGLNGIRFGLKYKPILEAELRAVKEASLKLQDKKFQVLFPQVTSLSEINEAKIIFDENKTDNMDFGVIIETPSAVQIIESICQSGIKNILIGTDDLIQFTLAIDKDHDSVRHIYEENHPSLVSQIRRIINSGKRNRIEVGIYGASVYNKEIIEILYREGIDYICVNPEQAKDVSVILSEFDKLRNEAFERKKQEKKTKIIELKNNKKIKNEIKELPEQKQQIKQFDELNPIKKNETKDTSYHATKYPVNSTKISEIIEKPTDVPSFIEGYKETELNEIDEDIREINIPKDTEKKKNKIERIETGENKDEKYTSEQKKGFYKKINDPETIPKEQESDKKIIEPDLDEESTVIDQENEELIGEAEIKDIDEESKETTENYIEEESGIDDTTNILDLRKKNHYSYFDEDYA